MKDGKTQEEVEVAEIARQLREMFMSVLEEPIPSEIFALLDRLESGDVTTSAVETSEMCAENDDD